MPKISREGGASNGASPVVADPGQYVTVGQLAALLSQLGLPLTLTGTAGYGAPSESAASASVGLLATFVRPDVAVATKVLVTGGIGVGNSAAGSTLGTVVKKVEIFSAAGASLGFVPVYDAIT